MGNPYKSDFVKVNLDGGKIHRSFLFKPIGEGDNAADRFGVEVFRNGNPEELSGTACAGFFIRPDGITLIINGVVSGNTAFVELPQAAYAISGNFTLSIKLSGSGFSDTVRIVDGTVVQTTTGSISDPSQTIPDYSTFEELVERAEEAAEEIAEVQIGSTQITGTRYRISVTTGGS